MTADVAEVSAVRTGADGFMAIMYESAPSKGFRVAADLVFSHAMQDACVLIVEDYEPNVVLLKAVLGSIGISRVHVVRNGQAVVHACQTIEPDLILLDLHMPIMDGFAVLDALRAIVPSDEYLPVLVLTADATPEAKHRALAAGAKDFLTKPFEHSEVVLRVLNLLEARALYVGLRRHNAELAERLRVKNADEERRLEERRAAVSRIHSAMEAGSLTVVFQPIVDLQTGSVVGVEALSRFSCEPHRPPDKWFAEAADVDLGVELELVAVNAALAALERLPDDMFVSINGSPEAVSDPRFATALSGVPAGRVVIELTEHAQIPDYDQLNEALSRFRDRRTRLAVDDAGAGFAGLHHILRLLPDIIKLDLTLTRDINSDPVRRALAVSLLGFSHELHGVIVAEGIETPAELDALRQLHIPYGQGYHLGRPGPLPLQQGAWR
jgi:EAL domain-containing protein (putative c-di-GMP-specific phosphodiesterase class I)/DNA-binding NarL/FixJ family response regulator